MCHAMITPTPESILEECAKLREENERLRRRNDAKVIEKLEDEIEGMLKMNHIQTQTHARYKEDAEREARASNKTYMKINADRSRILKKSKRQEKEIEELKAENERILDKGSQALSDLFIEKEKLKAENEKQEDIIKKLAETIRDLLPNDPHEADKYIDIAHGEQED